MEYKYDGRKDQECRDEPETYRTEPLHPLEKYQAEMGSVSNALIETAPYANYPYVRTPIGSSNSEEDGKNLETNDSSFDTDLFSATAMSSPENSDIFTETNNDPNSFEFDSLGITQRLLKRLQRDNSNSDPDSQPTPVKKLRGSSDTCTEFKKDSPTLKVDSTHRKRNIIQSSALQIKKLKLVNIMENDHEAPVNSSLKRKRDCTLQKLDISKAYGYAKDKYECSTSDSGFSSASSTLTKTPDPVSCEILEEQMEVEDN